MFPRKFQSTEILLKAFLRELRAELLKVLVCIAPQHAWETFRYQHVSEAKLPQIFYWNSCITCFRKLTSFSCEVPKTLLWEIPSQNSSKCPPLISYRRCSSTMSAAGSILMRCSVRWEAQHSSCSNSLPFPGKGLNTQPEEAKKLSRFRFVWTSARVMYSCVERQKAKVLIAAYRKSPSRKELALKAEFREISEPCFNKGQREHSSLSQGWARIAY